MLSTAEHLSVLLESLSNVRSVKSKKPPKSALSLAVNKAKVGAKFKKESAVAIAALSSEDPAAVEKWLSGTGKEEYLAGGKFAIERDMVAIGESAEGYVVSRFDGGKVYLKTEIRPELYEEAMVREVSRRIQLMRKEQKLVESDRISLNISTHDKKLLKILEKRATEISSQVNAFRLQFLTHHSGGFTKEWEIDGAKASISMEKAARQ